MKRLKVTSPLLILALAMHAALAETEFGDSVPREVVNQFIGDQFGGAGKLYSDILDAFPPFMVPAAFTVLASADQGYIQRVILKTALDEAAARTAIAAAFTADGWQELPIYGRGVPQTGFVSAMPPAQPMSLCKDTYGNVTLNVSVGAAPRYVSVSHNAMGSTRNGQQQSCAEQIEMMTGGSFGMRMQGQLLAQYAPRLIMPASTAPASRQPMAFVGGGGGGSSSDWETDGTLTSAWSIDEVLEHFTTQVDAQGWVSDFEVIGATVATASWTKTVDDMDLVGLLTIVATADDTWSMKFRVVRKNTATSGSRDVIESRNR